MGQFSDLKPTIGHFWSVAPANKRGAVPFFANLLYNSEVISIFVKDLKIKSAMKGNHLLLTAADYDFGARRYLPFRVPRWTSMDPMEEKYFSISPYAYCAGDPVNLVDPSGMKTKALGNEAIETFRNMLSDEELKFISFDEN